MKIKLSELRKIIRETIESVDEEAWVPGRWTGDAPVRPEEMENMFWLDEDEDLPPRKKKS